jgi:hypothetical protein
MVYVAEAKEITHRLQVGHAFPRKPAGGAEGCMRSLCYSTPTSKRDLLIELQFVHFGMQVEVCLVFASTDRHEPTPCVTLHSLQSGLLFTRFE